MKIKINLDNFLEDILHNDEIIDSNNTFTKLILIGKSGIHIKKKNRGSFTSYCGGKVTDECIRKAKNSPSAAIRKKATFADNARHWAKKHLLGGTVDLSDLFISPDTPPTYELNNSNFSIDDFDFGDIRNTSKLPENNISIPNESEKKPLYQVADWLNTPKTLTTSSTLNETSGKSLMDYIKPHLGKPYKLGNYDCSNFVSRVIKDMGYSLYGNSRTLWNGTSRIDMNNIKPGDLVFLLNTLPGKVAKGLASHVAIVTNTDRLKDGFIEVAHNGRTGGVSNVTTWNLNNDFYKNHLLGAGRLTKQAKKGFKFLTGGLLPFISPIDISDELVYYKDKDFDYGMQIDTPTTYEEKNSLKSHEDIYKIADWLNTVPVSEKEKSLQTSPITYSGKGYNDFKINWDKYVSGDKDASRFEKLLTSIAKHESGFSPSVLNTGGAPAYGYFLFWEDGNTNNITHYSGLSIDEFRNNPEALIAAAVKMARSIEKQFNKEDLRLAKEQGYSMNALIRGAWLGGVGGVRKVLRGQGNPSDSKWYKNGKGRSVKQAMDEQV